MATAVFMEENKVLGLTPVQFGALIAIREVPGTDATRVSDVIFFDRATIGNVLERLEKRGLIVRKSDAEDKRTKRLFLTPKGQAIIKKIDATASLIAKRILAPLPAHERSHFLQMLATLTEFDGRNAVNGNNSDQPPLSGPGGMLVESRRLRQRGRRSRST